MTSHQPIRTALIGLGIAGSGFHTPLILSLPELFVLCFVVDVDTSPHRPGSANDASFAAKFGANTKFTSNYNSVLADQGIELIVIATPTNTHFEFAKAALGAGKHVLLDKPVTTTHNEAKILGQLAEERGRIIYAFQNRRWDSDFLTVQRLIREGILGDITDFESHYDRYRDYLKGTWKEQAVPGGGQFYSLGPHLIDQALHCFGRPTSVTGFIQNIRGTGDLSVDDDFTVILHYARTDKRPTVLTAILRGHLLSLRKNQLRYSIRGSHGTFSKYGIDPQEEQLKQHGAAAFALSDFAIESPDIWGTLETISTPPSSSASSTSGDDNGSESSAQTGNNHSSGSIVSIPIESERGRYQDLYMNLFATIRTNATPAIQWSEAELTMLITELAIQSSKEGRTVQVPPADAVPLLKETSMDSSSTRKATTSPRRLGWSLFRSSVHRKGDTESTRVA